MDRLLAASSTGMAPGQSTRVEAERMDLKSSLLLMRLHLQVVNASVWYITDFILFGRKVDRDQQTSHLWQD